MHVYPLSIDLRSIRAYIQGRGKCSLKYNEPDKRVLSQSYGHTFTFTLRRAYKIKRAIEHIIVGTGQPRLGDDAGSPCPCTYAVSLAAVLKSGDRYFSHGDSTCVNASD